MSKSQKEAKRLAKLAAENEARKQIRKQELHREVAAQALKKDQIDKTWRELMLKIKEPLFKQEVEIMWHTFDRAFDRKDHIINNKMKLMDVADDQFQRTIASFCVTIDAMINKFLVDLDEMSKENDIQTKNLLERGQIDAARLMQDHIIAETHLQLMIFHSHVTADSYAWTKRGENLVKEDEFSSKYGSERENLRSLLENQYNNFWDEYKTVLKNYVVETAENQKQVRKLRLKENIMADIIATQGKQIANSSNILGQLRAELASYESGTKQAVFRERRNRHRAACHNLKRRMTKGCDLDAKKLVVLVKESDSAMEWLTGGAKKGEKILRLNTLCRKLESQREKVLPYAFDAPDSATQEESNVRNQDPLIMNAILSTCGLTKLWHRISKAELTRRALYREKLLLQQENLRIALKIQEYRDNKEELKNRECSCTARPINPVLSTNQFDPTEKVEV